jgi:hypothetical protein
MGALAVTIEFSPPLLPHYRQNSAARGAGFVLPKLDAASTKYSWESSLQRNAVLAQTLIALDVATPEDWRNAEGAPRKLVQDSLQRWLAQQGSEAIARQFELSMSLVDSLDPMGDARNDETETLIFLLEPESAAYMVLGPAIEEMEKVHALLPRTFYRRFCHALNRWIRIYDYLDAIERVQMLQDWYEQDEPGGGYELPDVAGEVPKCLTTGRELGDRRFRDVVSGIRNRRLRKVFDLLSQLETETAKGKRPELSEDFLAQFMDANPPLPALLTVFRPHDNVEACFDEEGQTMLEACPEPSLIVPLQASSAESLAAALNVVRAACRTLAVASDLVTLVNEIGGRVEVLRP